MLAKLDEGSSRNILDISDSETNILSALEHQLEEKVLVAVEVVLKVKFGVIIPTTNSQLKEHFCHILERYTKILLEAASATLVLTPETTVAKPTETLVSVTEPRVQTFHVIKLAEIQHKTDHILLNIADGQDEAALSFSLMRSEVETVITTAVMTNFGT